MINLEQTRIEIADHVLLRPVEGTGVMLDLDTERYVGLDETALRMVQTAADSANLAATVTTLTEIYDADASLIETDLVALVSDLGDRGLIKLVTVSES